MLNQIIFNEIGAIGVQVNFQESRDLIRSHRTAYLINTAAGTAVLLFRPPANDFHISPGINLLNAYPPVDQLEHTELLGNIHSLKEFPAEWIITHGEAVNEPAYGQFTPSPNPNRP